MINFALIGAGRIGKMHAEIIKANLDATLKFVYDVNSKLANEVADISNAEVANTPEDAINSSEIDAVLIASATPTHIQFIKMSANAGKAVFCEKPIDLDISKLNQCKTELQDIKTPIQIGFNRRFAPQVKKIKRRILNFGTTVFWFLI